MLKVLQKIRDILNKLFAGRGLGKKFPFLWKIYDRLFCLFSPKQFIHEVNGVKLLIDLGEPDFHFRRILQDYSTLKEYEPNTVRVLRENIKEGNVVLDIGASIGVLTFVMSDLVGKNGKVYAFEPTPACFHYLCENKILNGADNVEPFCLAAWDKDELINIQPSLKRNFWANGLKLDDWLEFLGVKRVDFIKMDIDGGEPFALRGLVKTIENNPKLRMIIEYYPKYIKKVGGNPQDVLDILDRYFTHEPIKGDYGDGYWNLFCKNK